MFSTIFWLVHIFVILHKNKIYENKIITYNYYVHVFPIRSTWCILGLHKRNNFDPKLGTQVFSALILGYIHVHMYITITHDCVFLILVK